METPEIPQLRTADRLEKSLKAARQANNKKYNYYYQKTLRVPDYGVSTPPKLRNVQQLVPWPAMAVDLPLERISCTGFYSPRPEDQDMIDALMRVWRENDFLVEQIPSQKDSMITGAAYISVSSGDVDAGEPEILWRSESPQEVYGVYDERTRSLSAVLKVYEEGDMIYGEYIDRDYVLSLQKREKSHKSSWQLVDAQENPLKRVPFIFMPNDSDSSSPMGRSLISYSIIANFNNASRTLMDAEVTRSYFAQPLRSVTGLNPASAKNPDGSNKSLYDMISGSLLMLPLNTAAGNGESFAPQLQQLTPSSPEQIMKMIDTYAKIVAQEIGVPASYLGVLTANPSSADAIIADEKSLIMRVGRRIPVLQRAYKQMAKLTLDMLGFKGRDTSFIEALFKSTETPTPAAQADRIIKLKSAGLYSEDLPEYVLREAGLSESEIVQQRAFLRDSEANSLLSSLLSSQIPEVASVAESTEVAE